MLVAIVCEPDSKHTMATSLTEHHLDIMLHGMTLGCDEVDIILQHHNC